MTESARNGGAGGGNKGGRNQPGAARAIMVITREHVHYDAAVSTLEERLGAARFRLGPLLPLAYFVSPSIRETINRACTVRVRFDDAIGHVRRVAANTRTFNPV